ncbi:MAG TPA: isochorismatase family cysteine hydrolase [Nitrospiraceae bacterium]|nr:isochorismatase family cysteine hydrolase [Nitrospiraceae bacterium]
MTPPSNHDLHGNVPDTSETCLLIIDMINQFSFPGADAMLPPAMEAAKRIADLKRGAKASGVPVIYVNDNFGKWQYDFKKLIGHCLKENCQGKVIVELLCPDDDDYFVLKPKHSGFFSTPLDLLLKFLKARRLILTGIAGNSCVLVTANDAYMRDFELVVPADCVVSLDQEDNRSALEQMRKMLKADIRPSIYVNFHRMAKEQP